MDTPTNPVPFCPAGESTCSWLEESIHLRQRVAELDKLVSRDPLTGLHNYRHFSETLSQVLERTRRSGRPSCLIFIDLDFFKRINDTWGHEVGNLALTRTAAILRQQTRMVDVVCRYGGEEFAIILPDTQLRQAVEVAERIRHTIEQSPVVFDGGEFNFTASMGVDVYRANDPVTPQNLIESADRFLYQAKEEGRNRVAHRDFAEVETHTSVSREERDALQSLFG